MQNCSLIEAHLSSLGQGISFLKHIPAEAYRAPCQGVFNSSIGGHIRHNLDHYLAFAKGWEEGRIDYDARERNPDLETDPEVALALMEQLKTTMEGLSEADLDRPLQIRMDDGGDSSWSGTSLRRELQFLLSHTIHHYALVVSIATRNGFTEFPEAFGVAPSTLNYQRLASQP